MAVVIGVCCAGACAAEGTWVVWDGSLRALSGRLTGIEGRRVALVDEHGLDVTVEGAVAMVRREASARLDDVVWSSSNEWDALVTLTDGQRWEAEIVGDAGAEDLELRVRRLGRVSLPLDVVRSVSMMRGPGEERVIRADAGGVLDRVELANGDVLRGTVIGIGRTVEIERESGVVRVERGAVRWIGLVNPDSALPAMRVWYSSGSVFGARAISGGAGLRFDAVGPTAERGVAVEFGRIDGSDSASELVGVEFVPGRLVAVSSLEVDGVEAEGGRRWTGRPRVVAGRMGQGEVVFPGPMAARFALPGRGVRAAGRFSLGEQPGEWADCVVRLEQAGVVLWEGRLNRATPAADFGVELGAGREMTVRVLAGEYGPVQDRVELRLGWVLMSGE